MHKYIGLSSNIQRELNLHELNTYVYMYNTNLLKTISNNWESQSRYSTFFV